MASVLRESHRPSLQTVLGWVLVLWAPEQEQGKETVLEEVKKMREITQTGPDSVLMPLNTPGGPAVSSAIGCNVCYMMLEDTGLELVEKSHPQLHIESHRP